MPVRKIENPEQFRENVRSKLLTMFPSGKQAYAVNLEKGIHNWCLQEANTRKIVKKWDNPFFVQIYLDHLRSVYVNLKNHKLVEQVESGEIKSHTIAFMTHQEMQPERWDELIRLKSIRDKNKYEEHIEASTDTFTCRKCKSKRCSYYAQQVRSSDEPMTLFCGCLDCGARWRTS